MRGILFELPHTIPKARRTSGVGRLCCKSRRADSVKLKIETIESTRRLFESFCVLAHNLGSMFLAEMLKRLLQHNRHFCDITRRPRHVCFRGDCVAKLFQHPGAKDRFKIVLPAAT